MPTQLKSAVTFLSLPCLSLLMLVISTDMANGQLRHSRQPALAPFRWLGHGHSAGYHWQNPGPNPDYYNPYTAHNSLLISKNPGYQNQGHNQWQQGANGSVPYSVYAPTDGVHSPPYDDGSGQSINPSFKPSEADDDEDEDDEENSDDSKQTDAHDSDSDSSEPGSIIADDQDDTDSDEDADFEDDGAFQQDEDGDDSFNETSNSRVRSGSTVGSDRAANSVFDFSSFNGE